MDGNVSVNYDRINLDSGIRNLCVHTMNCSTSIANHKYRQSLEIESIDISLLSDNWMSTHYLVIIGCQLIKRSKSPQTYANKVICTTGKWFKTEDPNFRSLMNSHQKQGKIILINGEALSSQKSILLPLYK